MAGTEEHTDPTKEIKPEDDQEELRKTLKGILGWVEKEKVAAKAAGKTASPWGWVVGLIAAVLVFIALAFAAWQAWKKGREIAKLKHKIDVTEEEKRQAEVNKQMQVNKIERKKLEARADTLKGKIDGYKERINKLEDERKERTERIDRVTSWEDVDKLLGGD